MSIDKGAAKEPSSAVSSGLADGLPWERRRWAVAAIFTALAMASLDTAIANIALPAISSDLHVSAAESVWVVNVYQIAMVATLLPLGALGEIVGHQRIYLGGLLLFTIASLGCALAWSLPTLVAARANLRALTAESSGSTITKKPASAAMTSASPPPAPPAPTAESASQSADTLPQPATAAPSLDIPGPPTFGPTDQ